MEEWGRLGERVLLDLKSVGANTKGLIYAVDSTREKLRPWAAVSVTEALARRDIGDSPVALLGRKHPSLPAADLDRAFDELLRLGVQHFRASRTFLLYGRREGDDRAQWLGWYRAHGVARICGAGALKMVRAAAAQTRTFEDAVRSFPPSSPGWTGWMAAADKLAACAVVSCTVALKYLFGMYLLVEAEYNVVQGILMARPVSAGGWRPRLSPWNVL